MFPQRNPQQFIFLQFEQLYLQVIFSITGNERAFFEAKPNWFFFFEALDTCSLAVDSWPPGRAARPVLRQAGVPVPGRRIERKKIVVLGSWLGRPSPSQHRGDAGIALEGPDSDLVTVTVTVPRPATWTRSQLGNEAKTTRKPIENVALSAKWNVHIWIRLRDCYSRLYTGTLKSPADGRCLQRSNFRAEDLKSV